MKTLEEVNNHLMKVGYTHKALDRIVSFLIGANVLDAVDHELECVDGERNFLDFVEWFNGGNENVFDDDEFGKGDFIHVEKDMDVLCLSEVVNGKFVGTNGTIVHQYELTKESRPCYEDEIEKVEKALQDNGVCFCYDCDELEVFDETLNKSIEDAEEGLKNSIQELKSLVGTLEKDNNAFAKIAKAVSEPLIKLAEEALKEKVCKKCEGECLDCLEIQARESLDNIFASLYGGEMKDEEKARLIDCMNTLVVLGKEYE